MLKFLVLPWVITDYKSIIQCETC